MLKDFLELDKKYKKPIIDFLISNRRAMSIFGAFRSKKADLVHNLLENYTGTLVFEYSCFEYSTLNDILLNLYDKFKNFVKEKNISFKKSNKENFEDKIIEYFRFADFKSVLVLSNFSAIKDSKKILDFIFEINKSDNIKTIVISEDNIFENSKLDITYLKFEDNSPDTFSKEITKMVKDISEDELSAFYSLTNGSEAYLEILQIFFPILNISIATLVKEYKKKNISFMEFLLNKTIIVVGNYLDELKTIASLLHPVSKDVLFSYDIISNDNLEYLLNKNFIKKHSDGYQINELLKEYFLSKMSLKESSAIYEKIINMYKCEIAKSPISRLLRLSRETMRQIIPYYQSLIPVYDPKKVVIPSDYTYLALNMNLNTLQQDTKQTYEPTPRIVAVKEASALIEKFEYQKALNTLLFALNFEQKEQDKVEILQMMANCYNKLGDTVNEIDSCQKIAKIYKNSNMEKYYDTIYNIANIYKTTFDYKGAETIYKEILSSPFSSSGLKILSKIKLLDMCKNDFEFDVLYKKYLDFIKTIEDEKMTEYSSKLYYNLACLCDNNEQQEEAFKYYLLSLKSGNVDDSSGYAALELADMYETAGNYDESNKCLDLAIDIFSKLQNYDILFDVYLKIASRNKYSNPKISLENYSLALQIAKKDGNKFKLATANVNLGDMYYQLNMNKEALECYFNAKRCLLDDKKNSDKIAIRINDMKQKMSDVEFYRVSSEYE